MFNTGITTYNCFYLRIVVVAICLAQLTVQAATYTSDPIGVAMTTATANGDTVVGAPLYRATVLEDTASSITSGVVTAGVDLTGLDLTTESHFLLMTSGANAGKFYTVTASNATTITVDLNGGSDPAVGTYKVIPYWTLDTLFPDGGSIPASPDPFNPVTLVMFNDVTRAGVNHSKSGIYLYHDGSLGPAGWYNNDALGDGTVGNTAILPETFITIRNQTGSDAEVAVIGQVPEAIIATEIGRLAAETPQDNATVNPYPAPILLDNAGLISSGAVTPSTDPFSPIDLVMVFDDDAISGFNITPSRFYFYYQGDLGPDGWYNNDDLGAGPVGATDSIPAGGAFIIRKGPGAAGTNTWAPDVPYTLSN